MTSSSSSPGDIGPSSSRGTSPPPPSPSPTAVWRIIKLNRFHPLPEAKNILTDRLRVQWIEPEDDSEVAVIRALAGTGAEPWPSSGGRAEDDQGRRDGGLLEEGEDSRGDRRGQHGREEKQRGDEFQTKVVGKKGTTTTNGTGSANTQQPPSPGARHRNDLHVYSKYAAKLPKGRTDGAAVPTVLPTVPAVRKEAGAANGAGGVNGAWANGPAGPPGRGPREKTKDAADYPDHATDHYPDTDREQSSPLPPTILLATDPGIISPAIISSPPARLSLRAILLATPTPSALEQCVAEVCRENGVDVFTLPDCGSRSLAEFAAMQVLVVAKKVPCMLLDCCMMWEVTRTLARRPKGNKFLFWEGNSAWEREEERGYGSSSGEGGMLSCCYVLCHSDGTQSR